MDRKSLERLRLDRRLIRRRGWIGERDLDRALGALPDVSAKARRLGREGGPPPPAAEPPEPQVEEPGA